MFYPDRYFSPFKIAFAFVATHNHFVLDRGGKVFNRSAPIIKLPGGATEDDHLALLAYLNSSVACFWMKQVLFPKYGAIKADHPDPARNFYEFAGTALAELPVPALSPRVRELLASAARHIDAIVTERSQLVSFDSLLAELELAPNVQLTEVFRARWNKWDDLRQRLIFLQEEIDWLCYSAFQLADTSGDLGLPELHTGREIRGNRPFEPPDRTTLIRSGGRLLPPSVAEMETAASPEFTPGQTARRDLRRRTTESSPSLQLLETNVFKRLWRDSELNETESDYRRRTEANALAFCSEHCLELILQQGERLRSGFELKAQFEKTRATLATSIPMSDAPTFVAEALLNNSVPFLSVFRHTDTGLLKRAQWETTWDLQRHEDAGEKLRIPVPPKYDSKDYRSATYWRLRGKLDVSKERFISYPGAEKDDDKSPIFGWAGWDYLQQATALAGLYHERKTEDGFPADRLVPLLAGLLELVPWLKQWHNAPNDDLGGEGPGDWYERYVEAESRCIGKTVQDLRDWRPAKGRGSKAS